MVVKVGFVDDLNVNSELVQKFYQDNWQRKIALSDKTFYEWQFINNPKNQGLDQCVIGYDTEKKVVLGVMGLNARDFHLNGSVRKGAELTTWIVSPEAQGLGIGKKILHYIQSNFEVLIGMGISQMALPIYLLNGFRYLDRIPRFVKVINFENIKQYCDYDKLGVRLIDKWSAGSDVKYTVTEFDNNRYADIFEKISKRLNCFSRNNHNREWRYNKHPYFTYKQFLIRYEENNKEYFVYIAIREENTLDEFRLIHVMDMFGDDEAMESGLSFLNQYARDNSYDVIDFYCTTSSIYRFMFADGWFSINDDHCFQLPHLFHPVEMRTPPTTSLIFWSKDDLKSMADLSNLYITKQDADLDRPTSYTLQK